MVMAFARTMDLRQPVVLGCSMGGALVLELARLYGEEVGAVIGLEAASKIEGCFLDWSVMPDIAGSVMAASWTYGPMAPQSLPGARHGGRTARAAPGSTGATRTSTAWIGTCAGGEDEIDTGRCPVNLLTGKYDYACTAEESAATAAAIPGANFTRMKGIGHFPMTENYPMFREYLLPVLRKIE